MSVDPSEPETFENTELDKRDTFDVEAPEADFAEQHHEILPRHDDPLTEQETEAANEADRAEQARVVELNEDDYR